MNCQLPEFQHIYVVFLFHDPTDKGLVFSFVSYFSGLFFETGRSTRTCIQTESDQKTITGLKCFLVDLSTDNCPSVQAAYSLDKQKYQYHAAVT